MSINLARNFHTCSSKFSTIWTLILFLCEDYYTFQIVVHMYIGAIGSIRVLYSLYWKICFILCIIYSYKSKCLFIVGKFEFFPLIKKLQRRYNLYKYYMLVAVVSQWQRKGMLSMYKCQREEYSMRI